MNLGIVAIVLPVFVIAGAGYLATRLRLFSQSSVSGLMEYARNFAIPCLLFQAISTLDLNAVFDYRLLFSFYAGAVTSFLLGILGARRLFGRRPGEAVAVGFCALFSNSVLLGLPIMERAYGIDAMGPSFAIVAVHAPFCYLLGITIMEFARADGQNLFQTGRAVVNAMFRNAMVIGLGLGFLVNLTHVAVPETLQISIGYMARSGLPAALFALGGLLTKYSLSAAIPEAAMVSVLSLVLHPMIAYLLAGPVFHLPVEFVRAAVVTAAMAPGVNGYVFASYYARSQAQAASAVLLGTMLSVISIPVWLWVLSGYG